MLFCAIGAGMGIAQAQVRPDAGTVLRDSQRAPAASKPGATVLPRMPTTSPLQSVAPGAKFTMRSLIISGNTVYKGRDLYPYAQPLLGREVGLEDLQEVAGRITDHYRRGGYFLAQVVIPPQGVRNGAVELQVIEGRIGVVRIDRSADTPVPEALVQGLIGRIPKDRPLTTAALEHGLLLASDVPGMTVQSALQQGEVPGTSDLMVDVAPSRRWDLSFDADNHGSRSTGEYRVGVLARFRSPLELGDNVDLRLLQSSGAGLAYGRFGYELPVNYAGTRAGIGLSRVQYALGGEFAALDATGEATVVDVAVTHPIVRGRFENLIGRIGYAHKRLEDHLAGGQSIAFKESRVTSAGLTWEVRDGFLGGGFNSVAAHAYWGDLAIASEAERVADAAPGGRGAQGPFSKFGWQAARLQGLTTDTTLFLGVSGQHAGKNLDSSERMALGGPGGVRAYPASEGIVDEGLVANVEYRYSLLAGFTASAFYDYGRGRVQQRPPADEPNHLLLRGYGLGMQWAGSGFNVRSTVAWRATDAARSESNDRNPRLYVQVVKAF